MRFRHLVLVPLLASSLYGQSNKPCPAKAPLTLEKVLHAISGGASGQDFADNILSCHVSFSLGAANLERLTAANVSDVVYSALSADTLSRLTRDEARTEANDLERTRDANQASIGAERDLALKKLEDNFRSQRQQADPTSPRGQFETSADYKVRQQQAQDKLQLLDSQHTLDVSEIQSKFAMELTQKDRLLDQRLDELHDTLYRMHGVSPVFGKYDPDRSLLTASVSDVDYLFAVEPEQAKAMYENWKSISVSEDFSGDARYLEGSHASQPIKGMTVAAAAAESQARKQEQEAAVRARAAQAEEDRRENEVARQKGYWIDSVTGLKWMIKDNGKDIDYQHAIWYCNNARVGGFDDWRLPSMTELQTLYDPTSSSTIHPPGYYATTVHINHNVEISQWYLWSPEKEIDPKDQSTLYRTMDYNEGHLKLQIGSYGVATRALCVRSTMRAPAPPTYTTAVVSKPSATLLPVAQTVQPSSTPAAASGNGGPVRISAGVMAGQILQKTDPVISPIARAAHVSGTVVLHAVIGKDGTVKSLQPVSGPSMLISAAVDAVRMWRYNPYLLNGQAVEVETTILVIMR